MCVLLASQCFQLWFLPWKLPLLNLVDAISTAFFLALLAVAMQVTPVDSSLFLDIVGSVLYYTSLAIIAAVAFFSLLILALERCCLRGRKGRFLRLVTLGDLVLLDKAWGLTKAPFGVHDGICFIFYRIFMQIQGGQPEAEDIIATLLEMMSQLKSSSTIAQERLAKKMTVMLSVYDLCTVQRGLEILGIASGKMCCFLMA